MLRSWTNAFHFFSQGVHDASSVCSPRLASPRLASLGLALGAVVSAWLGGTSVAHGQACVLSGNTYPSPDGQNACYVNAAQFQSHLGVNQAQVGYMVEHAASTWNLSGRSGWLHLHGTTSLADDTCSLPGHYVNRVTMFAHSSCNIYRAFAIPVCQGQHWWVNVCPNYTWSTVGNPGTGEIDLITTLAHEFGHVLNLGHPSGTFCGGVNGGAVMCPSASSPQSTRQRDVYPWDIACSYDATGARNTLTFARFHSSGSFGAESLVDPVDGFRGAPGAVEQPSFMWFRAMHRGVLSDRTWLTTYNSASGTFPAQTHNLGARGLQLSVVWWHEQIDRIRSVFLHEIASPG